MTPITAEISAAPHMPHSLRPRTELNALAEFMGLLANPADVEVIEENGELFLVAHPVTVA